MTHNNVNPEKQQQYLIAIICIVICALVLSLYLYLHAKGLIQNSSLGSFLDGLLPNFFAAAIGVVIVYFLFTKKGIDPYTTIREAILENKRINENLQADISITKNQIKISEAIHSTLDKQNTQFRKLVLHLLESKSLARGLSNKLLDVFLDKFETLHNGLNIKDEYLSLDSYIAFWEYLSDLQESKKGDGNGIIVRVVHSNSVHIWTNEHEKYKDLSIQIYRWQKKFISNGGIIVRILIGKDEYPNELYQKAITEMEKCGIDVKYIQKPNKVKLQHDFLMLYDEKFTVKWRSDVHGEALSECHYIDALNKEDARTWQHLWYELNDKGNPIVSIPKNREFFIPE